MMNLNEWTFNGRLTADPESKFLQDGTAVTNFRVAVNNYGDKTIFVNVTTWRSLAENCNKFLEKGQKVTVSGRVEEDAWETDQGERRTKMYVTANFVEFGERSKSSSNTQAGTGPEKSADPATSSPVEAPKKGAFPF